MRRLLLPALLAAAACSQGATLVVADRLAPGGGAGGGGGQAAFAGDTLDILVHMEADATDFNPGDLIRLLVNGVDRTEDVVFGGNYGLLRLDPSPVGIPQFVELYRRTGPVLDSFTYNPVAGGGPTLTGVAPDEAMAGQQVTLSGTGLNAGALRVFFGGVEGTVVASDATSVTATVPAGAIPGLVFLLVGADAARGVVPFQPLDTAGQPVPMPTSGQRLFAAFPARGGIETLVEFWGVNFDDISLPRFSDRFSSRIFEPEPVTLPLVGEVLRSMAVVAPNTMPGPGFFRLERGRNRSNELPFTVDGGP